MSEASRGRIGAVKIGVLALLAVPLVYLAVTTSTGIPREAIDSPSATQGSAPSPESATCDEATKTLTEQGLCYLGAGDAAAAAATFKRAIEADPNQSLLYNNLCVAYNEAEQWNLAAEACRRAIALDPGFVLASNNLKWAESHRTEEIEAILRRESDVQASTASAYRELGLELHELGANEDAVRVWSLALQAEPTLAQNHSNLAVALIEVGRYDDAIAHLEKAIEIDGSQQLYKNNLAWAKSEKDRAIP